ncbi:tetratricopeptide repeat protein [Luteolibacter soli]|uniref:Tetratricopeptide repeat protein n=1 Tax=Luteolibacter soli TaxID=3135280 RepID=A0ABU9AXD9_9BACT
MKSLLIGSSIALVFMMPACKKPVSGGSSIASGGAAVESGAATTAHGAAGGKAEGAEAGKGKVADRGSREELSKSLKSANAAFGKHDIEGTMKVLDEVPEEFRGDPGFLTLRGACYTEKRDFKAALEDFKEAAKKKPGDPSIRFNIAEMSFVTKDWDEAIKAFQVLQSQGAVKGTVGELVDFKLMLCEEGRGNDAEFERRAAENLKEADTLLAAYTKAAMEYRDGKADEAKATLADASAKFTDRGEVSPYYDTMVEFGYDPRK